MVAVKMFYIEAPSEDAALTFSDDETLSDGAFQWEFENAAAEELSEAEAKRVREKRKVKWVNFIEPP